MRRNGRTLLKTSMAEIRIDSILGGESPVKYLSGDGQYLKTIGIDPDLPISDAVGNRLASGVLRPSAYAKFSSTGVDANPYWIITNPKDALVYSIQNNGKIVSYSSSFGSETSVGTASSSSGNGAAYYNNYLYVATNTNVSRYGPLNGTPSLTDSVWTGATLGSKTALVNTTYPSIRGSGTMPNHVMHVHTDGVLYLCDYDSTSSTAATRGKGLIHKISTMYGTYEGDTDDTTVPSAYNALDLPPGFMPTCLESLGNDLVIGGIQTSNSTLHQGRAMILFWDTFSDSFYNPVALPDALVTAMKNINGVLYIFTGNITTGTDVANGYRVSVYAGGQSIQTIHYSNTGAPPLAGAVEAIGDKVCWGTFDQVETTTAASPTYYAVVKSIKSKDPNVPSGVHGIIKASATGAAGDAIVTALKNVQQASLSSPKLVVGWRDASTYGLDKAGTTYGTSVFHSQLYNIGRKFVIKSIRFNLPVAVAANMTITPKIFLDDFSSSSTAGLTVINSTNYANSERSIQMYPNITGNHNFVLELTWSGTALIPVLLPIFITFDVLGD